VLHASDLNIVAWSHHYIGVVPERRTTTRVASVPAIQLPIAAEAPLRWAFHSWSPLVLRRADVKGLWSPLDWLNGPTMDLHKDAKSLCTFSLKGEYT
jgi:hypothetical protein